MLFVPVSVPVSRRATTSLRAPRIDRLLDDAVDRLLGVASAASGDAQAARQPAIDVTEEPARYVVTLDVPGVGREDIDVQVEGRQVRVVAERRAAPGEGEGQGEAAGAPRVLWRERAAPRYARRFALPADLDPAGAEARLDQGVLTLTLPKRGAATARVAVN